MPEPPDEGNLHSGRQFAEPCWKQPRFALLVQLHHASRRARRSVCVARRLQAVSQLFWSRWWKAGGIKMVIGYRLLVIGFQWEWKSLVGRKGRDGRMGTHSSSLPLFHPWVFQFFNRQLITENRQPRKICFWNLWCNGYMSDPSS